MFHSVKNFLVNYYRRISIDQKNVDNDLPTFETQKEN